MYCYPLNMIEQLFGSKTRVKLLRLFLLQPGEQFYVREITRALDVQINAVRRELETLLSLDIISEVVDNPKKASKSIKKYYRANTNSLIYTELRALLQKSQRLGEREMADVIVDKGGDISLLLLTGRFVDREKLPSDMLIVGKVNEGQIEKLIGGFEKETGFEIRYTVFTVQEYIDRKNVMDKFLFALLEAPSIKVVDEFTL
jgi:DNA-binding transcriptional ArsR family regulator